MTLLNPSLLVMLLLQSPAATPPALSPEGLARHVKVTLSIRNGKTVFRSGEPIRLVVSFTSDRPGYMVDHTVEMRGIAEDQILISPDDGLFRWLELYSLPRGYWPDSRTTSTLSTQPVEMTLPLNYWFRFDAPGEYVVRVRTHRIGTSFLNVIGDKTPWLTTNEVRFSVVPMTEAEESLEVRRLGVLLDGPPADRLTGRERCEELAFLTGDAAAREKVRRYTHPPAKDDSNCLGALGNGFYISRSPSLIVSLFEEQFRDPTMPANYIPNLVDLRVWMEMTALVQEAAGDMAALEQLKRARSAKIQQEYVAEALVSLAQRVGAARRRTAAYLIGLMNPTRVTPAPPVPAAVRQILVDEFGLLEPMTQGFLIQNYWNDLRDPKLIPALERMLTSEDGWVLGLGVKALFDLAPEKVRPVVIAEMVNPKAFGTGVTVDLPDETIPEVDRPLVEQITALVAPGANRYQLENKTRFLARYATGTVLQDVRRLYEEHGRLESKTRAHLLAYLDRWDEVGAPARLADALKSQPYPATFLGEVAAIRYSPAVDAVVRARLASNDPYTAESAASLISERAPTTGRSVLEARLTQWINEWRGRTVELEPEPRKLTDQGRLQAALIRAILTGKAWTVSETDAQKLKQSCLTEGCLRTFGLR